MSIDRYKSLTISEIHYSRENLIEFAQNQISNKSIAQWEIKIYDFILDWISDSKTTKVKTSGSTSTSKWIEVEKTKMVKSAKLTGQFFNFQENDCALLCLPVDFIAGKMIVIRAFVLGLNLIPIEPSANPLTNYNGTIDFAAMTPMQVYYILEKKDGFNRLNQIRNLIIGGGDISNDLLTEINKLKNNTYHTYGMTETLTHVALKRISGVNSDICFKALPGIVFSKDKRGCLIVSASHLSNQQFITNDIIELVDSKTFNFVGRYDNVINSGGIKIFPETIERKLHPFLKNRFIVTGLPDDLLGQKVVLIIEQKKGPDPELKKIFKNANLSKYEIPKKVFTLHHFPETENGKIIRQEITQKFLQSTNSK